LDKVGEALGLVAIHPSYLSTIARFLDQIKPRMIVIGDPTAQDLFHFRYDERSFNDAVLVVDRTYSRHHQVALA